MYSMYCNAIREIILPPNTTFKVIGKYSAGNDLHIVHLQELPPQDPIVEYGIAPCPPTERPQGMTDFDIYRIYTRIRAGDRMSLQDLFVLAEAGDHLAESFFAILYVNGSGNNLIKKDHAKARKYIYHCLAWMIAESQSRV